MAYKVWMNMSREKVNLDPLEKDLLDAGFDFRILYVEDSDDETILRMGRWADAVISGLETWTPERLDAVRDNLRFLLRFGTGTDNIDVPHATRLGIPVANIPGANAAGVAEAALLHMLNLVRKFSFECYMPGRRWGEASIGSELGGKTVGIVGFGNIGKQLARMLSGFGTRVLAYDPIAAIDETKYGVTQVDDVNEIFRTCDFVSLHVPLTPQTTGMVNATTLGMMKRSAFLINTCRGGVVNETDLLHALQDGTIAGAGLDVLNVEPGDMDSPLFDAPNTVISAHIGGRTQESVDRSLKMLGDAIKDFFAGKVPFHMVNPEVLAQNKNA